MKDYSKKIIKLLKPSATLAINEKSKDLISKGKKVYKFGFGQSPFPVPKESFPKGLVLRVVFDPETNVGVNNG